MDANANNSRDRDTVSLVYVNGSHEYAIFDPRKSEELVISRNADKKIQADEPGECVIWVVIFLTSSIQSLLATVS